MPPTSAIDGPGGLIGRLSLDTPAGLLAGGRRIRLLEAIAEHGSITRAAKAVPLSYKAAWDAVDAMNNLSDQPLVERVAGGRQGGGTRLTDAGRRLVGMYRALEQAQQGALAQLQPGLRAGGAGAAGAARQAIGPLQRLSVRSSARNQFIGEVASLSTAGLAVEVMVQLDHQTRIAAGVTRDSAQTLGLRVGAPVLALVKASSVLLGVGAELITSARNQLHGTVSRVLSGPVQAEVSLSLPAGRSVTASITRGSRDRLGLVKGQPAFALFKASSVILVALD